jgi:hypothetical protein
MNFNAVQNTFENGEPCSFYKPSSYTFLNTSEAREISSYYLSQPYSLIDLSLLVLAVVIIVLLLKINHVIYARYAMIGQAKMYGYE